MAMNLPLGTPSTRSAGKQPSVKTTFNPIQRSFWKQTLHELKQSNKWGYVFIAPLVIDFIVFVAYLIVKAFAMAFQEVSFGTFTWVGLENFKRILIEPEFFNALKNTTVYTLAVVPGGIFTPTGSLRMIATRPAPWWKAPSRPASPASRSFPPTPRCPTRT